MTVSKSPAKALISKFYSRDRAEKYESVRNRSEKWAFEEKELIRFLEKLPKAEIETILDVPVGTNRFSDVFESMDDVRTVYGMDLSVDMLSQAIGKPSSKHLFLRHDIISGSPDITCDTAVCFRFLNLFPFKDVELIFQNIAQTSRFNIILAVRLTEEASEHGNVLQQKIHLHYSKNFYELIEAVGFQVKEKRRFIDRKGGEYYVMHAIRKDNKR